MEKLYNDNEDYVCTSYERDFVKIIKDIFEKQNPQTREEYDLICYRLIELVSEQKLTSIFLKKIKSLKKIRGSD